MKAVDKAELKSVLQNYYCAYWLRPETAIWRTADHFAMKGFRKERPILDVACGDGLNSYIIFGGKLPLQLDDSLSVKNVTPKEFFEDHVDIYNSSAKNFFRLPKRVRIDAGLDWKQGLLDKADKLGCYGKLVLHDANKLPLPFKEEQFETIFCNALYWMKNFDGLIKEFRRILKRNGKIILLLMNPNFLTHNIYNRYQTRWSKYLDRGRHLHYPALYYLDDWKRKFDRAGLKIDHHVQYLSPLLAQVHEVGLRPLSPVLIKMANSLSVNKRASIKKEFIEYMTYLTLPMFEEGLFDDSPRKGCFYAVQLSQKRN